VRGKAERPGELAGTRFDRGGLWSANCESGKVWDERRDAWVVEGTGAAMRRIKTASKRERRDVYDTPNYAVAEVAGFLFIPTATLRSWVVGRNYPTASGTKRFRPVIQTGSSRPVLLSFRNVVEAHVLSAIRREHGVELREVRRALDYVGREFGTAHPLADHEFQTDGIHLFLEKYGRLVNASAEGQMAMRELLEAHLRRVDRSPSGVPIRLYPFTRPRTVDEPRSVAIDPTVAFGRPTLIGTGIPTEVVADRFNAGESIDELASDYGRTRAEIEEAIRFERRAEAA